MPAAIVTFLSYVSYGAILTLVPDWSQHLGAVNKGLFFMVFTVASLIVRFVAGKASDHYGRLPVARVGLVLLCVSLAIFGYAESFAGLIVSSAVYGVAMGILSPATNAWTIDLSHPDHRGKAMATMYIALEAGIGLGALLAGWFYQDVIANVPMIMYVSAGITLVALVYLWLRGREGVGSESR
jgi:MFS family permease